MERKIYEYLLKAGAIGAGNAIQARVIQSVFSLKSRDFYQQVETERQQGAPIAARRGYFVPVDEEELSWTTERMRLQGQSMIETAQKMEEGFFRNQQR